MLAARIHRIHPKLGRLPLGQQLHQPPGSQVVADDEVRLEQDAGSAQRGQPDDVAVVGSDRPGDRHDQRAVWRLEAPVGAAARQGVAEAGMVAQLLRGLRRAVPRHVTGAGAHDAAHAADLAGDQVRLWQRADAHGQVEAVLDQVHLAVAERNIELHLRVGLRVGADDRREPVLAVRERDRHPQHALRRARHVASHLLGFLHVMHDLHAAIIKGAPRFRQAQAPGGAVHQPRAQVLFQLLDLLGDHGARDLQLVGGRRETATIHYRYIHPHRIKKVHGIRLSIWWK